MKQWFLGAVVLILVAAFGLLSHGMYKSSLTEDQETQIAQEAQKAQDAKAKEAAAKQVASAPPAPPAADASPDTTLPAEEVVGDPATAKHHIEVGWVYKDTDVVNSDKLRAALGEVRTFAQKSGGTVSAVIVDLDVPTEDRTPAAQGVVDLGVDVDGQSVYAQNPSNAAPGTFTAALEANDKS